MPSLVSMPPNIMTAAFDTISAGASVAVAAASTPAPPRTVAATWRSRAPTASFAPGPIAPPIDTRSTAERPGQVAAHLRVSVGRQRPDQPPSLAADLLGKAAPGVRSQEGAGERVTVATVLLAVERQHARADDLRGREPRVVDGVSAGIAHHVDAQVASGDQPAIEHRNPGDGLVLAEVGQGSVRIDVELVQRQRRAPREPGLSRGHDGSPLSIGSSTKIGICRVVFAW